MRTAEEIYLKHMGKAVNVRSVYYQRAIDAMNEYAAQFIHPTICYACNGSGRFPELTDGKCVNCQGIGKVILLPTITNTGT